ncbi:Peptidyl-prolyl cis-trans isomerase [Aphelenchoides besseyi]|nr:Peptidyl-prolyl cis-trans isomerase [Aphelenchoides besseyi]KAI6212167.1 Peptidyl-prolyl cis-trans isomerase [Aphelenchoides besseyi]
MNYSSAQSAPFVKFTTSMGTFVVELYWQHAPKTCQNMAELARSGYFDNTIFHRIIADFMIQGGDPTATGRGGTSIYGGQFEDEIDDRLRHSGAGIVGNFKVSMANSGKNTNGSQFFITLAPTQHLDSLHTIFGRISAGMKVIQKIGGVMTDNNDKPLQDVRIIKAYPTESGTL